MKFAKMSQALSMWAGSPKTFVVAVALIVIWAMPGPMFHYNATWQLIINTSTTIITFLMAFVIQNAQNRDNDIWHLKIDESLRATDAQNAMFGLDGKSLKALEALRKQYRAIGENETISLERAAADDKRKPNMDQC